MIEKVLSTLKKETDRQYFFSRLKNPLWIEPLYERDYFKSPPGVKQLPDGYVRYPFWPELDYLATVAGEATDQIIDIVLAFPKTDNPRIYDYIIEIALKVEGRESARLLPKILEYTELDNLIFARPFLEILQHWATQGNSKEALEIVKRLVPFQKDPRWRAKQQFRKDNPNALRSLLKPTPRFEQWEYEQILEKGVRPLSENEPFQVARILIDATASMIRMRMHQEDLDNLRDEDYSEVWCRRLDTRDRDYRDAPETLVRTLTYACEQVYEKSPESIVALDQALRNQRWRLFIRLRQHLYATHPTDQTLPWIRELIFDHPDYSKWKYSFEFQFMLRKASEHFGPSLLTESERSAIFDTIRSGPSKEELREWMGDSFSDKVFQEHQRHFHRMQLRPFSALLSGEYRRYFDELENEAQGKAITDEIYSPVSSTEGGMYTYRSPKSIEDLGNLEDEELLTYLNEWDDEHHDKDNWLVEINIYALASVFQTLFKQSIVPDGERLAYWMGQRDKIARPIYVATMVKTMQEFIKDQNFDQLNQWIEFCAWVLTHSDSDRVNGQPEPRDESRDHPDWGSSRRAVVDFIDTCVKKDTNTPISARGGLSDLLQQVCNQFDWRLDCDQPVLLNRDDQITEAINNTRSRALESLVNFGSWIRGQLPEDPLPEVTDILSKRMASNAEFPLMRPERALLGMLFGSLCVLNRDWSKEQREVIFPQDNQLIWWDAFGSYILYNRPLKMMFEVLRADFEYALENLNALMATKNDGKVIVDRLGQHLFTYYLWQVCHLTGDESLLERFYLKTSEDLSHWANLFDHVGRSLRDSGKHLDQGLVERAKAFFEWRLEAAEPIELQNFTFWLKAECLDPEWRLISYSKILDLGGGKEAGRSMEVDTLSELLPYHLSLVVECFAKITDALGQGPHLYVSADRAKPILKAGLNADDSQVRENAERAKENLLSDGRFDFLDVE